MCSVWTPRGHRSPARIRRHAQAAQTTRHPPRTARLARELPVGMPRAHRVIDLVPREQLAVYAHSSSSAACARACLRCRRPGARPSLLRADVVGLLHFARDRGGSASLDRVGAANRPWWYVEQELAHQGVAIVTVRQLAHEKLPNSRSSRGTQHVLTSAARVRPRGCRACAHARSNRRVVGHSDVLFEERTEPAPFGGCPAPAHCRRRRGRR